MTLAILTVIVTVGQLTMKTVVASASAIACIIEPIVWVANATVFARRYGIAVIIVIAVLSKITAVTHANGIKVTIDALFIIQIAHVATRTMNAGAM